MKFKVGDKVRMKNNNLHEQYSEYYPKKDVVGTIVFINEDDDPLDFQCKVNWGKDSGVKLNDKNEYIWWADFCDLCLVEIQDGRYLQTITFTSKFEVGDSARTMSNNIVTIVEVGYSLGMVVYKVKNENGHQLNICEDDLKTCPNRTLKCLDIVNIVRGYTLVNLPFNTQAGKVTDVCWDADDKCYRGAFYERGCEVEDWVRLNALYIAYDRGLWGIVPNNKLIAVKECPTPNNVIPAFSVGTVTSAGYHKTTYRAEFPNKNGDLFTVYFNDEHNQDVKVLVPLVDWLKTQNIDITEGE